MRELKNNFDVTEIEPSSTEIPKDINLLIIVHPKNFPAALNYAVDQYVMGGGRVVAFVDPYCEADQAQSPNADMQSRMQASYNSDMPELFKSWGVELVRDLPNSKDKDNMGFGGGAAIVADPSLAAKVRTPDGQTMDMIVWLQMSAKNRNDSEIITSQLDSLMVASGGELRKNTDSKDITLTPLIYTSDTANLISDMR